MKKYHLLSIFLVFFSFCLAQKTNPDTQLKRHLKKDTTRCFLLNQIIEEENDYSVWIEYNNELKDLALQKSSVEKDSIRYKTYLKYLSIAYNNEGAYNVYKEQFEKSILIYKKSFHVASKINYNYGKALALQNIATAFDYLGKIDSNLVYMQRAYYYAKLSKDPSNQAYVLTDLGFIHNNLGNTTLAINYNMKALKLFDKINDAEGLERTYFSLARIFENLKEYQKSISYYQKCLEIDTQQNNIERKILILCSLTAIFIKTDQIDQALTLNNQAFRLANKYKNTDFIATSYKNYGIIFHKKKELEKAKAYFLKAYAIFKKIKSEANQSKISVHLGTIYFDQNNNKKALEYALLGYSLAEKTNFKSDIKLAAELISQIYFKTKEYKQAYLFHKAAAEIAEKIYFDESKDIALKATHRYETEKKENQIKLLSQEKKIAELKSERQTTLVFVLITLFISIGAVSYFLFNRYKIKKQNELLKIELEEAQKTIEAEKKAAESELKALKSQMNPHFIFNALNSIQEQFMFGDKITANEQMSNFTYLTRQILEVSGKKKIPLSTEIEILTKYLELEKMRLHQDFEYQITLDEAIDDYYTEIPPMLIQPFVENSIKHGLMHREGLKKVSLNFTLDASETNLICTIIDNGIGREKSSQIKAKNDLKHESFSTKSIDQRLELWNKNTIDAVVYEDILNAQNEVIGTKVNLTIAI
ncbi:tetratricopeptide repeat protein [Flavobacterium faecale]|uniref:tetratricopeptide repeat protein n=1 Tax=Flavobacterium faecale TaxID=1355330 RepID=UPI003AAE8481